MEAQAVTQIPWDVAKAVMAGNRDRRTKTCRSWIRFHKTNPHVYDLLVKILREGKQLGMPRWSIAAAFEIARWERRFDVKTSREQKLPNEFRAFYARLLQMCEDDLYGYIRTTKSSADWELGWNAFRQAKKAEEVYERTRPVAGSNSQ